MATQEIIWLAVPNGFDPSGRARLSVYVAPQLQPDADGTLAPFDFLDWPARVHPDRLRVEVTLAGTTRTARIVNRAESPLWRFLFQADTFVRPYTPDDTLGVYGSYSASGIHDLVKSGYQETFDEFPTVAPSTGLPTAYAELLPLFGGERPAPGLADGSAAQLARDLFRRDGDVTTRQRLDQLVDLARAEAANAGVAAGVRPRPIVAHGGIAEALAQFEVFRRKPAGTAAAISVVTEEDTRLDFHQRLANLGEYPDLQRLLGLVIEVEFDIDGIVATVDGLVHVTPTFLTATGVPTTLRTPPTACVFEPGRRFHARTATPDTPTPHGLLDLRATVDGKPLYRIVQVDVDGAAMQTIELLHRQVQQPMAPDADGDDGGRPTLSALRTAGLSVVRDEHAHDLVSGMGAGLRKIREVTAGQQVTLFAEDLVRGLRVDINDVAAGTWRSLHERVGTYTFTATGEQRTVTDEGFLQPSLVQPAPAPGTRGASTHDPSAPNYVAESMFLWQGWSLAARRPAEVMVEPAGSDPVAPDGAVPPFDVSFRAANGSLPRLRFGRRYEVRIRTVDLAGNGLTREEATRVLAEAGTPAVLPHAGEEFRFCRFEPIASPVVLPRAATSGGETADRIVLRSTLELTPQEYAAAHPEVALSPERHLLPPPAAQQTAEMFGLFDTVIGTPAADAASFTRVQRGQRTLPDDQAYPEPSIVVPYLPDPLAAGVALRSLPGMPDGAVGLAGSAGLDITTQLASALRADTDSVVRIDFAGSPAWPDLAGFRLRLDEGTGVPAWDPVQRVLTVFLPKGTVHTCRISCVPPDPESVDLMGVWQWADERLRQRVAAGSLAAAELPARLDRLRQLSELGLSWMLTPFREIELVHAVTQPVEPPRGLTLSVRRSARQTCASVWGQAQVHGSSTGRVELTARWTELLDDSAASEPEPVTFTAPVYANPMVLPVGGTPAPLAGDPVQAAVFDPVTEVVTFTGPDLDAIDGRVQDAAERLLPLTFDLLRTAKRIMPRRQDLIDEASGFCDQTNRAIADAADIDVPDRWRHFANFGRLTEGQAIPPDPLDLQPERPSDYLGDLALLRSAAQSLVEQAEAAVTAFDRIPGRHEFGDTKHRMVNYQLVATSRFGEAFRPPQPPPPLEDPPAAGPDLEALDRGVSQAAEGVRGASFDLVRTAQRIVPRRQDLVDEAFGLRDQTNRAIAVGAGIDVPDRWRHFADFGRLTESQATPPDPLDGLPEQPIDYLSDLGQVQLAAKTLTKRAEAAATAFDSIPEPPQTHEPELAPGPTLTVTSEPVTVNVPSSARPPMPRVRFVVPAFAWQRDEPGLELHSSRGGGLRVYLDRPWFASGDGELLGVVLRPEHPVGPVDLQRVTTQWGRDPLWRTAATTLGPTAADFFEATDVFEHVQVNEPEAAFRSTVVAYRPTFDDRGRCFADIFINPHDSYYPFVRLALARYQPNSIAGLELSAVLQADFAQLAPHRSLTVAPTAADRIEVSVSGITHETAVDPKDLGRTGTWVRVIVQERIPGTVDDAGWQSTDVPVELERAGVTWHGVVSVRADRAPGTVRLLVEELETFKTVDPLTGDPDLRDRVVFAETYTLS